MMNEYISEMVAQEDKSTAEHSGRVAKIADILGRALSLSESELLTLDEAAKLHDVGKIKVDVKILQKPARLTDEEFAEIKKHTVYGFAMISPEDDMIAGLILSHHERWDGSGYPNGLSGCNIPYLSRVIAVADSIDAMMSDRCYRKALSWNQCLEELDKKGIRFALSNVLESKGKKNVILSEWINQNKKFKAIPLNYDYTNSNYHTKKDGITKEVLVVNY